MRRPLYYIAAEILVGLAIIWCSYLKYALEKEEIITCIGFLFLLASVSLLYFQIKSGLLFERRRTTHDFIYGPVILILLPLEKELKHILDRSTLIFEARTTIEQIKDNHNLAQIRAVLLDILNFYERMAIALRRSVLDEDMLYDDKGAVFLSLYAWAHPFVVELQKQYDVRAFANLSAIAAQWRKRYDKAIGQHRKSEVRQLDAKALPKRDLFS